MRTLLIKTLLLSTLPLICVLATLCLTVQGQEPTAPTAQQLRVLCYNIHHGRGVDGRVDLERLAKVINDCQPDLVALQEVDHRTQRTGGVDQTAVLGKLTGMHAQFARQIDFEGGQYGQALLSRWPLADLVIHWLPGEPERERRMVATCSVQLPGKQLLFGTTHLHHNNADFRLRQARAITDSFVDLPATIILAGDLNAEPQHPPVVELIKSWSVVHSATNLRTFPVDKPSKQIDYIFYRPSDRLRIVSSEVIAEAVASDHRPILAVLEWVE